MPKVRRKFKSGDIIRGVKLIKPTTMVSGNRTASAWISRSLRDGKLRVVRPSELLKIKASKEVQTTLGTQLRKIFASYRERCRRSNIFFDLTIDEFHVLTQKPCEYCKVAPSNGKLPFMYSGLDRKDNSMGYSKENIVPACARCNSIKGDKLSYTEMRIAMDAIKKAPRKGPAAFLKRTK